MDIVFFLLGSALWLALAIMALILLAGFVTLFVKGIAPWGFYLLPTIWGLILFIFWCCLGWDNLGVCLLAINGVWQYFWVKMIPWKELKCSYDGILEEYPWLVPLDIIIEVWEYYTKKKK